MTVTDMQMTTMYTVQLSTGVNLEQSLRLEWGLNLADLAHG